jgi:F420-non-reducing hydrogenase iron-sulfur subunit
MNITVVRSLKLFVMYCSTSFSYDELAGAIHAEDGDELKMIALPCSGKVDLLYLVKAFEKGADGLVLLTCPKNECHHLEGNFRALKRSDGVNSILEESGLGKERMTVISLSGNGLEGIASEITEFTAKLRYMTLNPAGLSMSDVSVVSR